MNAAMGGGEVDAEAARYARLAPGIPLIESPFFERFANAYFPEPDILDIARRLNQDGYAVIRFPDPDFDRVAADIRTALHPRFDWRRWRETGWASGDGMREADCWTFNADVKRIACNEIVKSLLSRLYGRPMRPFQTLNFPVSTQQYYHSDAVHFSTVPERFMCGVWVALEDVAEDAGPLVYFPGSHKWPIVDNESIGLCVAGRNVPPDQSIYHDYWNALVAEHGVRPSHFTPKKGEALIWAANLLHGGGRQRNPDATRWSQVTHYYAEDCLYLTPMWSDIATGNIYFRRMTDITTGRELENRYCGRPLADVLPGATYHRATHLPPSAISAASGDLRQWMKRALIRTGLIGVARAARLFTGRFR